MARSSPLLGQFVQLDELRIGRELVIRLFEQLQGTRVVPALQLLIDLPDPAGPCGIARVLLETLLQPLLLELEAWVRAVNGLQRFEVADRFLNEAALLMNARPLDDRVDQLALAFKERQQVGEVGLVRVVGHGLAQQIDLRFEVGLRVEAAVDVGDKTGQLLALLFVDVELERLE